MPKDADERLKLEALWVTWGAKPTNFELLRKLIDSSDHRIRAAAVRVLRFNMDRNPFFANRKKLLLKAAGDSHGRVRMEAVVAASFVDRKTGLEILSAAESNEVHKQYKTTYEYARGVLENAPAPVETDKTKVSPPKHLSKKVCFVRKSRVFNREAHCMTTRQTAKVCPTRGFLP